MFDVDRWPNEHVAFGGGGPHFCLGAHLGRSEIRAMLREILARMDGLRIAEATLIWIVTTNKGWAHLRGLARTGLDEDPRPYRADLFAASTQRAPGDDRIALRLYEPGADPNIAEAHRSQPPSIAVLDIVDDESRLPQRPRRQI